MTDGQITNRDLYEAQRATEQQLAGLALQVATLVAEWRGVGQRLDSGTKRMDDYEARLRDLKDAIPDNLKTRLGVIEADRQRRLGKADMLTVIGAVASSSGAAAVISFVLTRGH